MKKTLVITALVAVIAVSIISGTLALYTTTIDDLATGSVVAKEFILLENGSDTFETNVKIAPTETVTWDFSIKNFDGAIVTETGMDLDIVVDITAVVGKSAISPLVVTVTNEFDEEVGTQTGVGVISFTDSFELDEAGQTHTYTVTIVWPSDDAVDINYAGGDFGTAVAVTVTGTQK
ncbi:MAG: hypothetical protein CVU97_02165 [Firmicutes bacterium HGW-Firmicutes-21]|nr:MAG: hypothetical protein CVU97_02165 [Firmicutes bacterium HGW-Firmicutes-21]